MRDPIYTRTTKLAGSEDDVLELSLIPYNLSDIERGAREQDLLNEFEAYRVLYEKAVRDGKTK